MKWYLEMLKKIGMQFNGLPRYISSDAYFDNFAAITLSERTVISKQCFFLTHDYSPTTAFYVTSKNLINTDTRLEGRIVIKENVFIGLRVTILPNTIIEKNCIIGAGTVVKGHIPEGSVVVGNPAEIICSIDDYKRRCLQKLNLMIWD